ncbi:MAG TPA: TadE/TadG family type IV pilus assembly protein [Terracidiphilus sp.]
MRHRGHGEEGSALVETALTIIVMFSLLFGVIQISLAAYSFHYVSNAAHEASRYAIVRGGGWGTACSSYSDSMCTASADNIKNYVHQRSVSYPGISIATSNVCVHYWSSVQSPAPTTCTDSTGSTTYNSVGDIVQVTINYPFTFSAPGIPSYTYTLTSTSMMVIAQ